MNQVFSFKRFFWLMKRQWVENQKLYLTGIAAIVALIISGLWFMSHDISNLLVPLKHWGDMEVFFFFAILGGVIFSGSFFRTIASTKKAMFWYSLPVTTAERLAVAFTYVMILFPCLYCLLFYGIDALMLAQFNEANGLDKQMWFVSVPPPLSFVPPYARTSLILLAITVISAMALGSLAFRKHGHIKTIIVGAIIVYIFVKILPNIWDTTFVRPPWISEYTLEPDSIRFGGIGFGLYPYEVKLGFPFYYLTGYLIPIALWVALFFKIKEKEI